MFIYFDKVVLIKADKYASIFRVLYHVIFSLAIMSSASCDSVAVTYSNANYVLDMYQDHIYLRNLFYTLFQTLQGQLHLIYMRNF